MGRGGGQMSNHGFMSETPQQLNGKYGYMQENNFGGPGGYSQGEIRANGGNYGPARKVGGPVKAVDLGLDSGYSNMKAGKGGGGYDQYENFNSGSTKTSMQNQSSNSNYRKAFNPNTQTIDAPP